MLTKMIIKSISKFLLIQSIFFYSCSNVNDNQEKLEMYQVEDNKPKLLPDTIFACDTTQIGKLVWMAEDLQVETFRNGDSIKKVTSYEEWKEAEDTNTPALYIVEIDKKKYQDLINRYIEICCPECNTKPSTPKNTTYYLYNLAAIHDERKLAPKGWKIPHYTDWDYLLDYVQVEKYLLSEEGVMISFGNPYNFSLLPTPSGFFEESYTFDLIFATYWALEEKLITISTFQGRERDFNSPRIWHHYNSRKYHAACIRCIRE
jgi:uncharacterized protein (TIGR02145 family)